MGTYLEAGLILGAEALRQPLLPLWAMELLASLFLYAWVFCLGATVGSFLNVVVYRLPRGKNLAYPGSFCPHCGHPIRLVDNIPILSWLVLRGRCRDCRGPISARYLFVELAVATIFLGVALVETKLTGTFPRRDWGMRSWLISPYDSVPFWATYGLHVILLTTLLGAALIDFDGYPTPWLMFAPGLVICLAIPAIWPSFVNLPPLIGVGSSRWGSVIETASSAGSGLVSGIAIGLSWRMATQRGTPRFAPGMLLATVGAALGWQHALEIGAASTILWATAMLVMRISGINRMVPLAGVVFVATLPRLLNLDLRLLHPMAWPEGHFVMLATCFLAAAVLAALAAAQVTPEKYFSPPSIEAPSTVAHTETTEGITTAAFSPQESSPPP